MTSSTSSRRLTRSQTSSVLGKRPLSRASSVASLRSASSSKLLTPDTTPDAKKPRTSFIEIDEDPSANKENIPPLKDAVMETPISRRITRRATATGNLASPTPTRAMRAPRRNATLATAVPPTPSTSLAQLTLQTPPATPPNLLPLHAQVRACLRATSNGGHVAMSSEGRTAETEIIRSFLLGNTSDDNEDDSKPILYVSGSPGTGKTALVNSIIASLSISLDFDAKIVFLNCMSYQSVDAVWARLEEELVGSTKRGKRASSSKQKTNKDCVIDFVEHHRDLKCVLILDEIDHLSSISPPALRPLFNLATQYPSSIRVMGIANTHTLTSSSSSFPFDSSSSQSIKTIHFKPYEPSQLVAILNKRFQFLPQDELKKMLPQPALMLLTKKVAGQTGDVRVLFEVLRGAVDLAVASCSPSESSGSTSSPVVVTPQHILNALKSHSPSQARSSSASASVSTNSEIVAKIVGLGLQQRLSLLSLLLATKRLTSGLPLATSSSSPTPMSSPSKRSPMKRAQSSASVFDSAESAGDASAGIDVNLLFSFYSQILQKADAIGSVSRSEFADLLAVLETTGLVYIQSASTGRSSFKRSSSFVGRGSMTSASSASSQSVRLHGDVREAEVGRGMGLLEDMKVTSASSETTTISNVMQEEVRAIWVRELSKIKKEKAALARKAMAEGVDLFDDATES